MTISRSGRFGCFPVPAVSRRWGLLPLCLFLLLPGANVEAQRLLDLGPVIVDPAVAEPGVVPYAVDLDIDLVRSAPQRLEVPAPDGGLMVAELSVFEDRGGGDAMWAGKVVGSDYESVVFTVVNDHLAGSFGVPGGAKYRISARPDGRGRIENMSTMTRKPKEQFCPGGVTPDRPLPVAAIEAQRSGDPERVVQASNHNHLDMLIVYSEAARQRYEARDGSVDAPVQASIDYLNTVFRNGDLDVVARLVHHEQAPASLTITNSGSAVLGRLRNNQEVQALRAEYQADLVHIFVTAEVSGVCGIAYLLGKGDTAASFSPAGYGLTVMQGCGDETFAHEVGHNLGGQHDPPNASGCFEDADCRNNSLVAPYAFGHTWFSGSSPNPPDKDTIMSYGSGEVEPWFSTVRVQPRINGRTVTFGVAGERENERAVRGTIGIAIRFSDSLPGGPGPDPDPDPDPEPPPPPGTGPAAPGSLSGTSTGPTSVRLSWVDRSDDETGFEVQLRQAGSGWRTVSTLPANSTSADVDGLTSGGRYEFRVRSFNDAGRSPSNVVTIVLPSAEFTDCEPTAPQIVFDHGYSVSICIEYEKDGETVQADAVDYGLDSAESGLLYFFDRDNSEVLIKVLDACRINNHRWVFVAPVTTLAFNLYVDETATGERWEHRNPRGGVTATTESNIEAFPCAPAASVATVADDGDASDGIAGVDLVDAGFPLSPAPSTASTVVAPALRSPVTVSLPVSVGGEAECEPQPVRTLRGGYTVNMCVEHIRNGETVVEVVRDYELDSEQSAILYFFDRDNAEVLIKVLDGCRINGHRWVFVAPVTTLAFNLSIEPPGGGKPWTHENRLNRTAAAKSDIVAFACEP
ncbi:MAG: M12 family metallo-peptidase [Acidobacteria bacterium]|nr:M12 family metallo-peptidase [Acidobacteriota bacterium]